MKEHYSTKEAYEVYITYLALGKHFTSSYDYHKYNGKIKANPETFSTRNDVFFFYKLSKIQHWKNLLLSNIVKNPKIYVRELLDEHASSIYLDWKKRIDSLSHTFKTDLNQLNDDFESNFMVTDHQIPHLMTLYLQKKICLETFVILANITNVLSYWEEHITDKTISKDLIILCKKYYPFLEIDNKKFSTIIKNTLDL